jgi:LPS-assembly protein
VDSGSRVNYGLEWSAYNNVGGRAEVFLGQSYQFIRGDDTPDDSGIGRDLTDVVGRLSLQPNELLNASYRFRFDADAREMRRQEVTLTAGPKELTGSLSYVRLSENEEFGEREQVYGALGTQLFDYWTASAGAGYDMVENRVNSLYGGIGYNDECFGLNISAQYTPEADSDTTSGKFAAFVTFTFKNLGDIGASF